MNNLAYAPVHFNFLETLAKTFIIPPRQKQFNQGNILDNAPVRWIAIAMNTNPAFTEFYTENPFWYQQFDLKQFRKLLGVQPTVNFDLADNGCIYVTTMKEMNFQKDILSIPIGTFKNLYVLVFDLTSMQYAIENLQ